MPLSMKFSRQEYWSGLPVPSPGDLPDPGIESVSPALQANSLPSEPPYFVCYIYGCLHAKLLQLRPTLCDHMDCSLPGSSVHGILQARILERGAISSSGDPPNLGIEFTPLISPLSAGRFFTTSATWETAPLYLRFFHICWFNQPQIVYYYSIYYRRKKKTAHYRSTKFKPILFKG